MTEVKIDVKKTGVIRATRGGEVVFTAVRCAGRDGSGWPAGWTVTYSVPTRAEALAECDAVIGRAGERAEERELRAAASALRSTPDCTAEHAGCDCELMRYLAGALEAEAGRAASAREQLLGVARAVNALPANVRRP
jgi:secreted protein with Ig-like and vWFA domain